MFSSDAEADARIDRDVFRRFPHRSVLFAPMVVKEEPIGGIFVLWWKQKHDFTVEELRLVEGISRQAALAIEDARLYEGVKQQMAELKRTQAQLIQSAKLAAIGELPPTSPTRSTTRSPACSASPPTWPSRSRPASRCARSWTSSSRKPRAPATSCATC